MENTVIIKKDGTSIDSKDCHEYSLYVRMTQKAVQRGDKPQSRPSISKEELVAYTFEEKRVLISDFHTIDGASNALLSLIEAIRGRERMWDVREYIKNPSN